LLSPLPPSPPPAFASPVVGWLLRCFPPSAFVIARHHATVNALLPAASPPILVHHRYHRRCRCRWAATAAIATATTVVELTVVHCQRKRQQQHHHQRTNGSTKVKTFTNPIDLDLFKLIYSI
jgi:hypothetical protein